MQPLHQGYTAVLERALAMAAAAADILGGDHSQAAHERLRAAITELECSRVKVRSPVGGRWVRERVGRCGGLAQPLQQLVHGENVGGVTSLLGSVSDVSAVLRQAGATAAAAADKSLNLFGCLIGRVNEALGALR